MQAGPGFALAHRCLFPLFSALETSQRGCFFGGRAKLVVVKQALLKASAKPAFPSRSIDRPPTRSPVGHLVCGRA
jgi:hypothetical protein